MEYTQWDEFEVDNKRSKCLNPCCNGIYSMRISSWVSKTCFFCLNPCCNGIYSMRQNQQRLWHIKKGLNPCCNGIYSMRTTYLFFIFFAMS